MKSIKLLLSVMLMAIAGLVSCSDDFDAPPVKVPTATIKANTTIADFKAEYWKTETPYCVPVNVPEGESKVISGRVISSDATGNIYKSLVIQDETAALAISINANSLYTTYRVGQEVVIDLNGMYVGKYANLIQLGYPNEGTRGTEAGFMALELFESHAQLNGLPDVSKIDTIPVSISELPTTPTEICMMQSQLVRLDNVQWVEAGQRYSEESASTSRNLKDASGNTIIVRNSNYATFRTELLPEGEGTVIGILSYYNNAWQILLRSAEDVIGFKTPEGVMANPYTIERAKELQGQDITGWVAGYIVGAVAPGVNEVKANTDIQWGIEAAMDNSLVIGATADTKDIANCVIVPLPQDTKLRELGNIRDHKDLVGKAIKVKGVLENQYAQAGVNCSGALGTFEIEGVETGGDGTPSGDGTLANPFNCAGANEYTSGLAADTESPNNVYIKGKVVSIKEEFGSFGNASFYISDDGTANNQFYVYRALYLGNKKWTSGDTQIKVGDEVVICGKVVNYKGNTPETVQNGAYIYSLNGTGGSTGGGETGGGTASGNGTIDNPYNAAGVTAYINTLADNAESPNDVYIKGKIASVKEEFSTQFGNATFYISDDGTATGQFYVYRCFYLGNQKWTDGNTQIKAGDEVIICGKVVKYVSTYGTTPETAQSKAYIYSLNGKTGDGGSTGGGETGGGETGEGTGDGTLNNPYNIVAITSLASGLASGAESSEVYFKGKVSSIKYAYEASYGTGTFYVSDDGSTTGQFYVFRAFYLGNQKWVDGNYQIKVGDEVVIHGKVTNYMGNTPETVQNAAYLYSINGSTTDPGSGSTGGGETGGGETGGGETGGGEVTGNQIKVTFADFGIANGTAVTTLNLSDGTTLSFDGGGNTNPPKYYTAGTNVRMYPKNSMTVNSSKKIASIVINCDTYNGILCNAAEQVTASAGAVTFSGSDINIGTIDATTTTVTNANPNTGTASQIRMISMTITYAE